MAQAQKNALKMVPETPSEAPESANGTEQPIRAGTSLRDMLRGSEGESLQAKVAFMGDIRQKLAEVADSAKKSGEDATETERLAASAATKLYLWRAANRISGDELSGLLGDIFGYKPKQDGTPGKTPAGPGETIRKRIVRALQGHDFVNGGDGGRFFETMDADAVAPIINSIGRVKKVQHTAEDGTVTEEVISDGPTVWSAYKLLGDLKSQGTVRTEFAFDPKKIAGLGDKLCEAGARDRLINNPSLLKAYIALQDQLEILMSVDATEAEAIAQRLGVSEPSGDEAETENEDGEEVAA